MDNDQSTIVVGDANSIRFPSDFKRDIKNGNPPYSEDAGTITVAAFNKETGLLETTVLNRANTKKLLEDTICGDDTIVKNIQATSKLAGLHAIQNVLNALSSGDFKDDPIGLKMLTDTLSVLRANFDGTTTAVSSFAEYAESLDHKKTN